MGRDTRHAVWWLGLGQCVFWGVLYYGFSVWLMPIQRELAVSASVVAGAFSAGLLLMAGLAPHVGLAFDRGHGRIWWRVGIATATLGLLLLSQAHSLPVLYLAWILIGASMATLLYESAFALVQRAVSDPAQRLRAVAAVSVMGGLASTVFLPILGWLVEWMEWRSSALIGAGLVLLTGVLLEFKVLPVLSLPTQGDRIASSPAHRRAMESPLPSLMLVFGASTIAAMGLTTLLVPRLLSQGVSLSAAASVLATLGIAQIPGRLWMLRGGRTPPVGLLTVWPLVLQSLGLLTAAWSPAPAAAAVGVLLFGLGAGLHTLARPWLVQQRFGDDAGYRNGQVARVQGVGRALGPVLAVAAASFSSPAVVLSLLAGALLLLLPLAHRLTLDITLQRNPSDGFVSSPR